MQKRKSDDNPWRAAGLVSAVSADMIVCILLGYVGGSWLSGKMGGQKIYVAVGTVVGLFVGIVSVILLIKYYLKDSK